MAATAGLRGADGHVLYREPLFQLPHCRSCAPTNAAASSSTRTAVDGGERPQGRRSSSVLYVHLRCFFDLCSLDSVMVVPWSCVDCFDTFFPLVFHTAWPPPPTTGNGPFPPSTPSTPSPRRDGGNALTPRRHVPWPRLHSTPVRSGAGGRLLPRGSSSPSAQPPQRPQWQARPA